MLPRGGCELDVGLQVWRCEVDIAAVGRTCTDWALLLPFLHRRQPLLHPTCDIKALLLTIVKVQNPQAPHIWLLLYVGSCLSLVGLMLLFILGVNTSILSQDSVVQVSTVVMVNHV